MTVSAVRAWVLETGNFVDIEFNGAIDQSVSGTGSKIFIAKDAAGTTSTDMGTLAMVSTVDGKIVRFTTSNQATFEGWAVGEKATATLKLDAGAFKDTLGVNTAALAHATGTRVYFINEASMTTTLTYHANSADIYIPDNATIVQDHVGLDTVKSTREFEIIGRGNGSVLSGNINVGPCVNCSAADPLSLKLSQLVLNGDIVVSNQLYKTLNDGSANTGTDTIIDTAYIAGKVTTSAAGTLNSIVAQMRNANVAATLVDGSTYTGTEITLTAGGTDWAASKFSAPAGRTRYVTSITLRARTGSSQTVQAYIYSDIAGNPGVAVGSFTGVAVATVVQTAFTMTASSPIPLTAGTAYWIVVNSSTGAVIFDSDTTGANTYTSGTDGVTWAATGANHLYHVITASTALTYNITAALFSDSTGSPGTLLATSTTTVSSSSLTTTYASKTFDFADYALAGTTDYWVVFTLAGASRGFLELHTKNTGTNTLGTSNDLVSWVRTNYTFYHMVYVDTIAEPLSGYLRDVSWTGNFKYGAYYYFAGTATSKPQEKFYLDRVTWQLLQQHAANAAEAAWACINSALTNQSANTTMFNTLNLNGAFAYCNFVGGALTFSTDSNLTIFSCYDDNTTGTNVTNDITNTTGIPGFSLADTQGYGWISGGALNAGKAFSEASDGTPVIGEISIGCPRGAMKGVGAFALIPAIILTPTLAVGSGVTITYSLPAGSFVLGDVLRTRLNDIEDTAGNKIAQNTVLAIVATA